MSKKQGLTINWQCVLKNCAYRLVSVDGTIKSETGSHNHDPNLEQFVKREGRVEIKKAVAAADGAPTASVGGGSSRITYHTFLGILLKRNGGGGL